MRAFSVTGRVEFAHMLRGIAALAVVIGHYFGTFFLSHEGIAKLLLVPPLPDLPKLTGPAAFIGDYGIIFGQFGVGIFFIISGFVVPFSLASGSVFKFIWRRALRIFPTYIFGFSIVMISIWLLTNYTGKAFTYSFEQIVSHWGILTRGILGFGRIDGISWTLEIELVFYIILAVVGKTIFVSGMRPLILAALFLALASLASSQLASMGYSNIVGNTSLQFWASLLLVIGLAYHALFTGKIHTNEFYIIHAFVGLLIYLVWTFSNTKVYHWQWISGYVLAMIIFWLSYKIRERLKPSYILSHFADISYPLYVVHALSGYAIIYWSLSKGLGGILAIVIAFLSIYCLSVAIHYAVEKPLMQKRQSTIGLRPHIQ